MLWILKIIRTYIGGKTELGLLVATVLTMVYLLPIAPGLTWEIYVYVMIFIGEWTGVALFSRIEDKKGFFNALQSLFQAFRKSKPRY